MVVTRLDKEVNTEIHNIFIEKGIKKAKDKTGNMPLVDRVAIVAAAQKRVI